jgi:L-ascorbate metabolism protein UlaG (beta-lactamase superfamily)
MKVKSLLTMMFATCMALLVGPAQAQIVRDTQTFKTSSGEVKITPIWHPATLIQANGKNIYLDPYSQGDLSGLPAADLILITHTHGDHLDPRAVGILSKPETEIWAPAIVVQTLPSTKVITNGEVKQWDKWTIEAMPAYNIVNGNRHVKGAFNAYILSYGGKRFYFSGDTEVTQEMRALKNIDVAFVCMNDSTMPPQAAAEGVKAFRPKIVIPYHYRGSDLNIFKNALQGSGIEVRIIDYYPRNATPQPASPAQAGTPAAVHGGGTPTLGNPPSPNAVRPGGRAVPGRDGPSTSP